MNKFKKLLISTLACCSVGLAAMASVANANNKPVQANAEEPIFDTISVWSGNEELSDSNRFHISYELYDWSDLKDGDKLIVEFVAPGDVWSFLAITDDRCLEEAIFFCELPSADTNVEVVLDSEAVTSIKEHDGIVLISNYLNLTAVKLAVPHKPDTEENSAKELFKPDSVEVDSTFGQYENPEATWDKDSQTLTIEIKQQGGGQWGNRVYLSTGITTLDTSKEYQFSFTGTASTDNCGAVSFKAFDSNTLVSSNQNLPFTTTPYIYVSEWATPSEALADGYLVFDFGWDAAQTVTITNISIKERSKVVSYTISDSTTDLNGIIEIDKATAAEGETVTVTVKPASGYQLKSLDCSAVSASANANMLYLDIGIWGKTDPAGYFAHFQKDGGSDFGNTALVKGENNYYACEIPDGADTVTFLRVDINDISTLWNETFAQSIPSDKNRFAITSWGESFGAKCTGEWTGKEIQNTIVTTKKEENGTYTFTMPAANVTVTAEFEKQLTTADILTTVEGGFPSSSDGNAPSNAWVNSNNEKMFSCEGDLYVGGESDGDFVLTANTELTKDGNNYKCTKDGATVTFIMDDGALISISIEGLTDDAKLNGTYGPHVHSIQETYSKVESSCLVEGHETYYKCSCGKYFSDQNLTQEITDLSTWLANEVEGYIAPSGHNYQFSEFVWDEFTAKAKYVCSNDSSHIELHDATITSAVTTEPTCTTDGVRTYTATYDGHTDTKTEVIDATGHTYGKPTSSWNGNQVTLTVKCSCNDEQHQTFTGTYTKVSDATCTTKETGKYVLTISDGIYAGTYESNVFETGNPSGHETTKVNGQSATSTEDGYKDAYYCNDCGLYFGNADGTGLIGDSTAYEVWKLNEGFLPRLLSTGAIAGIVIGSVFGLLIIAFAVLYVLWKCKNLNVPILSKVLTPAFRFINKLFFKTELNEVEAKEAENKPMKE